MYNKYIYKVIVVKTTQKKELFYCFKLLFYFSSLYILHDIQKLIIQKRKQKSPY